VAATKPTGALKARQFYQHSAFIAMPFPNPKVGGVFRAHRDDDRRRRRHTTLRRRQEARQRLS
jgi:hypothetical protein